MCTCRRLNTLFMLLMTCQWGSYSSWEYWWVINAWVLTLLGVALQFGNLERKLFSLSQKCEKLLLASSCQSVCLSFLTSDRLHGTTRLARGGFSWNLMFVYFLKICWENLSSIKIWQEHTFLTYPSQPLEWEMFQTKVVSKIKTRISYSLSPLKSSRLWDNVEPGRPRMTVWRMRIACWLQTHSQYTKYLLLFHRNNCCTKAPQCYVIRTFSVLFYQSFSASPSLNEDAFVKWWRVWCFIVYRIIRVRVAC
jgi:hypothetical protein